MARFLPDVNPDSIPFDSERLVYRALQKLPDAYRVLHSYPWLRPGRDLASAGLREGEADFILLHPERGLLVLEVKGGTPRLVGRTWYREDKEMKDPFAQARRNRYALLDAIEERSQGKLRRDQLTHGDMVVFPHSRYEGALPLDSDPRLVVDQPKLAYLPELVEDAYRIWARKPTSLTPDQFRLLVDLLLPKLRLVRCMAPEVAMERERLIQITELQHTVLMGLLGAPRVLVNGVAGSGKTLLALEFALTLVGRGQRVLLLCYNRYLAAWLSEQADLRLRQRLEERPLLRVATFHALTLALAREARVEVEDPGEGGHAFWEAEAPLILEQSLDVLREAGREVVYDAVLVDEAQDFSQDWWVPVETLTLKGREGRLYAFLDLKQSLRRAPQLPSVPFGFTYDLDVNCRNTAAIARSSAALAQVEVRSAPGAPEGDEPALRRSRSREAERGLVFREVLDLTVKHNLQCHQLVLVGPTTLERSSLADPTRSSGLPLTSDLATWRRGEAILVTTARAFKGLEADVVILYGLSGFSEQFTVTDLYVAWTRARHRLILYCHGDEARIKIEAALAAAILRAETETHLGTACPGSQPE